MKAIINANIITMDANMHHIENGFVIIKGKKIDSIGSMDDYKYANNIEIIDAKGYILMPGMINTHTHLSMIPFRSLGDDCKDRLRKFLFPLENDCMTKDLAYFAAKYAICESLLAGVTTVVDMYYFEDYVAKAAKELNIRAFLGETVINFKTCDTNAPHGGLDYAKHFIENWMHNELITPFVAPHSPNTNDKEALIAANKLSEKYNVPISMHLAEMDYEIQYFKKFNQTPIKYLESIDLLSNRLIAAHCIYLTENDFEILDKYSVNVSHCIGSNTKAAKGVAPVYEMLKNNINVSLGTDGASSGNTLDIITQFKLFANFHKFINKDRSLFKAYEIIKLGTINAAKALNMQNKIGSIEVGKIADIVLIETNSLNMFPLFDPYSAIVYSANAFNVDTVFVNGKCVVKNKSLLNQDIFKIKEDLKMAMKDFDKKAKDRLKSLD